MATYATVPELADYLTDSESVTLPGDPDALERLLERSERRVDAACGPWPVLSTGRKFDPGLLDLVQRDCLSRATCAAAEHILLVGEELLAGDDDYLPAEVSILRRAGRISPKMLEELSGSGLLKRSGTVYTPPEVIVVP